MKKSLIFIGSVVTLAFVTTQVSAQAVTMQECSAKYGAAKSAGTLGATKWNDFRKSECDSAATLAAGKAAGDAPKLAEAKPVEDKVIERKPEPASLKEAIKPAAVVSNVIAPAVFPTVIAPQYVSDTPSKGRLRTCADQYKVNKDANANGGLKWVEKGGGFYSRCNAKLKG